MADDGSEQEVTVDPNAAQALLRQKAHRDAEAKAIFNPSVGRYDVQADTGPSYATQREETWTALIEVLKTRPEYLNLIGDILFRNADFKDADEIAERLKRIVPANVLGEGPSPEMQALAEQCKNLQGLVVQLSEKLVTEKSKARSADEKHTIGVYDAETKRIDVLLKALGVTPDMVRALAAQLETGCARHRYSVDRQFECRPYRRWRRYEGCRLIAVRFLSDCWLRQLRQRFCRLCLRRSRGR